MRTAMRKVTGGALASVAALTMLGGCVYRERTVPAATVPVVTSPAASPTTVVIPPATQTQTRVTYAEGAYELRGAGTATSPYYWVWIPRGVEALVLPPPPPLPR